MIRSVRIRGFKRFRDAEFRLPGHAVLTGANDTGKTTLLQAIASWALALRRWRDLGDFKRRNGYRRAPITRQAFFTVPLRSFDPGETPEISRMDLDRFTEVSGADVADAWIRLRSQTPRQPEGLPVPVPDPDLSDGPHLSYAFQWFFFSAGAVVVYGLILRRAVTGR